MQPVLPHNAYVGDLLIQWNNFLAAVEASFQVIVDRDIGVWASDTMADRVLCSTDPGVGEVYQGNPNTPEHRPPMRLALFLNELISTMAIAMEDTATHVLRLADETVNVLPMRDSTLVLLHVTRAYANEVLRKRKWEEGSASKSDGAEKSQSMHAGKGEGHEHKVKGAGRSDGQSVAKASV